MGPTLPIALSLSQITARSFTAAHRVSVKRRRNDWTYNSGGILLVAHWPRAGINPDQSESSAWEDLAETVDSEGRVRLSSRSYHLP